MSNRSAPKPFPFRFLQSLWFNIREFSGFAPATPLLWTRWVYLRAIGAVFVVVFSGIISEQSALAGSRGLLPVTDYLRQIEQSQVGAWQAFLQAPTLFWLNSSDAAMVVLAWVGLLSGGALVLNLWPRMTLFVCWITFLSFVSTWRAFSGAQLDGLMLEVALLSIPFAPRGLRPGLGAAPWSLAVFMVRWLLFRVMLESGLVKVLVSDPLWRNFTAMDHMYETAPFPTILGYFDHNMPQVYHGFEILLTFVAELAAPVLAFVAGRRGRWVAFLSWTLFQVGIQLTNNFGWLNTASIGLGLLLLDDQMLRQLIAGLRLNRLIKLPEPAPTTTVVGPDHRSVRLAWGLLLWFHFTIACFYLAKTARIRVQDIHPQLTALVRAVSGFQSVQDYYLYARVKTVRTQVEFAGSNDGGQTWRPYKYRYLVQDEDQINGFIAPRFIRFDATMQIIGIVDQPSKIVAVIATHLLQGNPRVLNLFAANPFPDQPPTLLRMRRYRLKFTDTIAQRTSGRYWTREPAGDYAPLLRIDETGRVQTFELAEGEAALSRGDARTAFEIFSRQYSQGHLAAGFRLVDLYMRGAGTPRDPKRAFDLLASMAAQGEPDAINHLGACYEYGLGTVADPAQAANWYRKAVDAGLPLAFFNLGSLYARHRLPPHDDVEALTLLLMSARRAPADNPVTGYIFENQPGLVSQLKARMTAADIQAAQTRADNWR